MPVFALNHMTVPHLSTADLVALARSLGCSGVELRNDLVRPLFDDLPADAVAGMTRAVGMAVHAVAEVKAFNDITADTLEPARQLAARACAAGAPGIALIPRVGGAPVATDEQGAKLAAAMQLLAPILTEHGLLGFIEPLGFVTSTLRFKADVAQAIDAFGPDAPFRIVHDTFHHALAGETAFFAGLTAMVHISGVVRDAPFDDMTDADRALVDECDRLGNLAQLATLHAAGYRGPVSFEAFSPAFHSISDPAAALRRSMDFIRSQLAEVAA